jgi:hypothetical protein
MASGSTLTAPGLRAASADTAAKRLEGIADVVSDLDVSRIQTRDEMARALWTLETAGKCIRVVLAEFSTEAATEQLKRQSEKLIGLIELVRDEIDGLRYRQEAVS